MALFAGTHFALLLGAVALMRACAMRDALSVDDSLAVHQNVEHGVKPFSKVQAKRDIEASQVCANCYRGWGQDDAVITAGTKGVVLKVVEPEGNAIIQFEPSLLTYEVKQGDLGELETLLTLRDASSVNDLKVPLPDETDEEKQLREALLDATARKELLLHKMDHMKEEGEVLRKRMELMTEQSEISALKSELQRCRVEKHRLQIAQGLNSMKLELEQEPEA